MVFKFRNFLFSVVMRLLLRVTRRVIGKPNYHLGGIKLVFLTMFKLNFVTVTILLLFYLDNQDEWNLNVSTVECILKYLV